MSDPYKCLGINRDASKEDIKRAYKMKAREHHPDRGGDQKEFQKIANAYEELTTDKPSAHTMDEDVLNQMFGGFGMGGFGMGGFGMGGFGGQRTKYNQQETKIVKKKLVISIQEAFTGINKKMSVNVEDTCNLCSKLCNKCKGTGSVTVHVKQNIGIGCVVQIVQQKCDCNNGYVSSNTSKCYECQNTRKVNETKIVNIKVSPGSEQGKQYIFEDIIPKSTLMFILEINLPKHVSILNNNIVYSKDISFWDTFLGSQFTFTHPSGEIIAVDTTNLDYILRNDKPYSIYGKGMTKNTSLNIHFNVIYPTINKNVDNVKTEIKELCMMKLAKK